MMTMAQSFRYSGGMLLPTDRKARCLVILCLSPRFSVRSQLQSLSPLAVEPHYGGDNRCPYHCTDYTLAISNEEPQLRDDMPMPSSDGLVDIEYADLNLANKVSEECGHFRHRQHVNPLTSLLSMPAEAPDWNRVFSNPTLPLMVDIGSGSGRFLLWHAKKNADSRNHLGLEIRQKLVKRANNWVNDLALKNAHFMYANATVSFQQIVSTYPGPLMLISILCPDPHFKNKHNKRRVVQKALVDSFVKHLAPGGKIYFQSDVLEVAVDMRDKFDAESSTLEDIPNMLCDDGGWLSNNPMGIRSDREIQAEFEGAKIYRRMYQKKADIIVH